MYISNIQGSEERVRIQKKSANNAIESLYSSNEKKKKQKTNPTNISQPFENMLNLTH